MAKFQKFMQSKKGQKMLGGLDDPIDKYFWYAVIGWGAAIVFAIINSAINILGIFTLLASLFALAGTVALVIWLIKKFS